MKKIKYIFLSLLGIFGLLLIWGLLEPYTIDTEEEVAEIPNLPSAWEGQRVALITDWQIGMWLGNTPTIRRTVKVYFKFEIYFIYKLKWGNAIHCDKKKICLR